MSYNNNIQMLSWRKAEVDQQQHIQQIHELAIRMKKAGRNIGQELQRQQARVEVFHGEMQLTEGRLGDLQKEVGELLETKDVNQICTCLMMCCFMIVLIILVIML